MAGEYVEEESVFYEPPDPNTLEPDVEPEGGTPEEKPEEKPKEKVEKEPEEEKTDPKPEEAKKPELPKGALKRINKLTARNYRLKKELAEKEKQLAEFEALKGEKKLIEEIAEHNDSKPLKGDFDSYEDYTEALTKWEATSAILNREKTRGSEKKPESEKPSEDHNEVLEDVFKAGREAYDDFEDIVQDPSLRLTETMVLAILETDESYEILYHLGSNPEESAKIAAMTPLQQAREIGKLELKLAKEETTQTPKEGKVVDLSEQRKPPEAEKQPEKQTKAPEPIEPVHGKSVSKKDPDKMSNEEYRAQRGYDRRGWRKG